MLPVRRYDGALVSDGRVIGHRQGANEAVRIGLQSCFLDVVLRRRLHTVCRPCVKSFSEMGLQQGHAMCMM